MKQPSIMSIDVSHWDNRKIVLVSVKYSWRLCIALNRDKTQQHDDVIKAKHFPRYWPFVWGIHRSPVNSPHKGQWHGALMFSLICAWINGWVNNGGAGDFIRYCAHYDVTAMVYLMIWGQARKGSKQTSNLLWIDPQYLITSKTESNLRTDPP